MTDTFDLDYLNMRQALFLILIHCIIIIHNIILIHGILIVRIVLFSTVSIGQDHVLELFRSISGWLV